MNKQAFHILRGLFLTFLQPSKTFLDLRNLQKTRLDTRMHINFFFRTIMYIRTYYNILIIFRCFNICFRLVQELDKFSSLPISPAQLSFLYRLSSLDYRTSTKNTALNLSSGHKLPDAGGVSLGVFPKGANQFAHARATRSLSAKHSRPRCLGKALFTFLHIHEPPARARGELSPQYR